MTVDLSVQFINFVSVEQLLSALVSLLCISFYCARLCNFFFFNSVCYFSSLIKYVEVGLQSYAKVWSNEIHELEMNILARAIFFFP